MDDATLDTLLAAIESNEPEQLHALLEIGLNSFDSSQEADIMSRLAAAATQSDLVSGLVIENGTKHYIPEENVAVHRRPDEATVAVTLYAFKPIEVTDIVCRALQHNTSILQLEIRGFTVDEALAETMAVSLTCNSTVRAMVLDVAFDEEAMLIFAAALAESAGLQTLVVPTCCYTDAATAALFAAIGKSRTLKSFTAWQAVLGEQGVPAAGVALTRSACLERLLLAQCRVEAASGLVPLFDGLARNGSLLQLRLLYIPIDGDEGAALGKALAQHPRLQYLHLKYGGVDQDVPAALAHGLACSGSLRELGLSWSQLTAEGAAALAQALPRNKSLTELDLTHNAIGDTGAIAIARALAQNDVLQRLALRDNNIGAAGASALGEWLARNRSLQDLDMVGVSASGVAACCKKMVRNQTLVSLALGSLVTDGDHAGAAAVLDLLRCNTSLCEIRGNENAAIEAALARNRLLLSDVEWKGEQPVACAPFASLWVVLTAIRGAEQSSADAALRVPPSQLISDVIFSLSRAMRPCIE